MKRESIKRIIAVLLAILMCASFAGCGKKTTEPEEVTEVPKDENNEDVILTLGDDEYLIGYSEFNYYYTTIKNSDGSAGLSKSELTTQTIYEILLMYAERKLADRYGYELTDEQLAAVDEKMEATKANYGTEAEYKEALRKARLNEETMRKVLEYAQIDAGLRSYVIEESSDIITADDATVLKDIHENFKHCKVVVFMKNQDGDAEADDEEDPVYDEASKAYQEYQDGATFDEIMEKYNQDEQEDPENGYYYTMGMLDENVENAVDTIKEGEVYIGVVDSYAAYSLVQRLPLDDDYINGHFEELRKQYITREYNTLVQTTANEMGATLCDGYDAYNFG